MIYGDRDVVPKSATLTHFVPNSQVVTLDCGHWIQQEMPEETTQAMLTWLIQQDGAQGSVRPRSTVPSGCRVPAQW